MSTIPVLIPPPGVDLMAADEQTRQEALSVLRGESAPPQGWRLVQVEARGRWS